LAKKVDDLRKLSSEEQANLLKFRDETLNSVKNDIALATSEYKALQQDIKELEEIKIRQSAPIDLTEEWAKVQKDKLEIEEWKRDLFNREATLILREGQVILSEQTFENRDKLLIESEIKAKQYLDELNTNYRVVENIRNEAEAKKELSDKEIEERYSTLSEKEGILLKREQDFKSTQEQVEKDKKETLERGASLISKESQLENKEKELILREETLKENELLNLRYISESQSNYEKTEKLLNDTQKSKDDSDKEITDRYLALETKEKELGYREKDLNLEKEQLEKDRLDIANERIHITSQQETLKVAWNNIKNLTK